MAVYAAMIDRMDQGIGQNHGAVWTALDIANDDTLIIFLSDNGGCAEYLAEDGWINSYVPNLPDGRPVHIGNRVGTCSPGPADTYMSYDLPWANASNSPFRLYKHWVHEGGISSPCILHYPALIRAALPWFTARCNSSTSCPPSPSWLRLPYPARIQRQRDSAGRGRELPARLEGRKLAAREPALLGA